MTYLETLNRKFRTSETDPETIIRPRYLKRFLIGFWVAGYIGAGSAAIWADSLDANPLAQAHQYLDLWSEARDASTSLVPTSGDVWSVSESAAGAYAAALMVACVTDPSRLNGPLLETLHDEIRLTSRLLQLPDDYDLSSKRFARRQTDPHRIARGSVRYALRLTSVARFTSASEWTQRARSIVEDLYTLASVAAPATDDNDVLVNDPLPSDRLDVNGPLLHLLTQLHSLSGDPVMLQRARRLADVYVGEVLPYNGGLPPGQWDFKARQAREAEFVLDEAGAGFLSGLEALQAGETQRDSARAAFYGSALSKLIDSILTYGVEGNQLAGALRPGGDGIEAQRRPPSTSWAEILLAAAKFSRSPSDSTLRDRVYAAADSLSSGTAARASLAATSLLTLIYPDSALTGLALEDDAALPSNLVESAEIAMAALSAGWHQTAGVRLSPWSEAVSIQCQSASDTLWLSLRVEEPWEGRLIFDQKQAFDAAGFPSRFSLDSDRYYTIEVGARQSPSGQGGDTPTGTATWSGDLLSEGIFTHLDSGKVHSFRIWPSDSERVVGLAHQGSAIDTLQISPNLH